MNQAFARFWAITLQEEGGDKLSLDRNDKGNWTGGQVGVGELRGTKYGISAAAFPQVDIGNMTEAYATGLAYSRYFLPMMCDRMPPALGLLVFDAAFNSGDGGETEMLQDALGLHVDGDLGPITREAILALSPANTQDLCIAFQAARLRYVAGGKTWVRYQKDLSLRLFRTFWRAQAIASEAAAGGVPASA